MEMLEYDIRNIDLEKIKDRLLQGEIIIYPTDTVYGVGASIQNTLGIEKIYRAKERSFKSPLIALVSDIKKIDEIAYIDEERREVLKKLLEKFWPGGLTIVLRKKDTVPKIMVSNGETIGIRMPNLDISLKIIDAVGGILPTTSANISGEKTPSSYTEISEKFKERVDIVVDGGKCPKGLESTIVDLTKEKIEILREGAIKKIEIEKIIGKI